MESTLARERQELSRSNLENARLESELYSAGTKAAAAESELAEEREAKVSLRMVPDAQGKCKRCEAFVIANGSTLLKLK